MAKYIENANIADLVDLGCFYQLNQPLTGLVMDHYIVIMIGGGLFLDNYVIINLYQQQIFQHLTISQIHKFFTQRALEERVPLHALLLLVVFLILIIVFPFRNFYYRTGTLGLL